jgi:probable F420-dependent oxidoreductase
VTQMSTQARALGLGRIGIWSTGIRFGADGTEAAAELEQLGFGTLWIPGGVDDGALAVLETLLGATSRIKLATGILNIWKHEPAELAAWWEHQCAAHQERLLLGLGISHGPLIGDAWNRPIARMADFLDGLAAAGMGSDRLCLAALGPKMLELSARRTAGAHPYMVTPGHTAIARQILGPDALLAPEQGVVLESDPAKARAIAREFVGHYARLPNYANSWRREGFTDEQVETLDDALIDALIAWGDVEAISRRLDEHFAAGADHVCVQVIGEGGMRPDNARDRAVWRELARLL